MEYGATVWDTYQKYNSDTVERVQRRPARFVKRRYSSSTYSVYKIINGFAQMPFEGVLVEAYKGTRRNLDRLAIQLASIDSRFS